MPSARLIGPRWWGPTLGAVVGMYCPDQDAFRSCMEQVANYAKRIHAAHLAFDRTSDLRDRKLTVLGEGTRARSKHLIDWRPQPTSKSCKRASPSPTKACKGIAEKRCSLDITGSSTAPGPCKQVLKTNALKHVSALDVVPSTRLPYLTLRVLGLKGVSDDLDGK